MFVRMLLILSGIVASTLGLAWVIHLRIGGNAVNSYGDVVIYCAIGLALVGCAFICGPGSSASCEYQMTAMYSKHDLEAHDKADRERATPIGIIVVLAALISGGIGYLLTN